MILRTAFLLAYLGMAGGVAPAQTHADEIARGRFLGMEKAVARVVAKVRPSTVAILSLTRVEFEGRERYAPTSGGSGVIIDPSGYIVTNDHVAGHSDALLVVLQDGRKVPAELIAKDGQGDIALIKIEGHRLPAAELGDSSKVKVGDWVLAVGNPFHLATDGEPIVTLGVVSGKHRSMGGRWQYSDSIQTDAEINPGNSGGPLFNLKGELVGINGLMTSRHGLRANTGAGYAIPVDVVKSFLPRLRQGKDIERGYAGIELDNKAVSRGVRVKYVARGSPAEQERVREGDIILALGGKPVNSQREWTNRLSKFTAGKTVTLKIKRKNRSRTVRIKLTVDPRRAAAAKKKNKQDKKKPNKKDRGKKDEKKQ